MGVATKIAVMTRSSRVAIVRMRRNPRRSMTARSSKAFPPGRDTAPSPDRAAARSGFAAASGFVAVNKKETFVETARCGLHQRRVLIVDSPNNVGAILALQPPNRKVTQGNALKMTHEEHVDGRAAERAKHRHCAGG